MSIRELYLPKSLEQKEKPVWWHKAVIPATVKTEDRKTARATE